MIGGRWILRLVVTVMQMTFVHADEHERRLYEVLLNNYNVYERPVENNSLPVVVSLKVTLNQIVDVVSEIHKYY